MNVARTAAEQIRRQLLNPVGPSRVRDRRFDHATA
jgi:hypothetical protein